MTEPLLAVRSGRVHLRSNPELGPVDGVDLAVPARGSVAIVGESGCGKSLTAFSILGLLHPSLRASGVLSYAGRDYDLADSGQLKQLRGGEIAMISQDSGTSLNPVATVGRQIGDVLRRHQQLSRGEVAGKVRELLRRVEIPAPERVARAYPFELSGGMRQRVLIAMALACRPKVLIADEPTTALDSTVQAQIMKLLTDLVADEGMALIFISHDLGLVAQFIERVYVMYAGRVVEAGTTAEVLRRPVHPYTTALVSCLASMSAGADRLVTVPGMVPSVTEMPTGCRFAPRCARAVPDCLRIDPPLLSIGTSEVACIRASDDASVERDAFPSQSGAVS